jgi:hypothetical protein
MHDMGNYDGEGFKFCQLGEVVNCDHHHHHIPIHPPLVGLRKSIPIGKMTMCWGYS